MLKYSIIFSNVTNIISRTRDDGLVFRQITLLQTIVLTKLQSIFNPTFYLEDEGRAESYSFFPNSIFM